MDEEELRKLDEQELIRSAFAVHLDELKGFYDKTENGYFVLVALSFCIQNGILIPDWAGWAFHKHWYRWIRYEVRTLDEAFNCQWPKGKHLDAARRKRELSLFVHERIKELNRQGQPIDQDLFEQVGKEFEISRERVREYYNYTQKFFPIRK